jgi:hypothetical protein
MEFLDKSENIANSVELITASLQPLQVKSFFCYQAGSIIPKQGYRKLANTLLESVIMIYQFASMAEAEIPLIQESDTDIEKMRKTSDYFWKKQHYQIEFVASYDNQKTWSFLAALPLKRAAGFPVQRVRLMNLITDQDYFRFVPGMYLGARFRDTGFGIPKSASGDFCTVNMQGVCEQSLYEGRAVIETTNTQTFVTQIQPLGSNAVALLAPARQSRTSFVISTTGANTITYTVRYGGVADNTALAFTMKGGETLQGLAGYKGEISFSATQSFGTRITLSEVTGT